MRCTVTASQLGKKLRGKNWNVDSAENRLLKTMQFTEPSSKLQRLKRRKLTSTRYFWTRVALSYTRRLHIHKLS